MQRRAFLRLLAATPVAAPAAASQAATAMGLTGPIGLGAMAAVEAADKVNWAGGTGAGTPVGASGDYVLNRMRDMLSPGVVRNRRIRAQHLGRVLDPDLAALRSASASWVYRQQVARAEQRLLEDEMMWVERECAQLGVDFKSLWQRVIGSCS